MRGFALELWYGGFKPETLLPDVVERFALAVDEGHAAAPLPWYHGERNEHLRAAEAEGDELDVLWNLLRLFAHPKSFPVSHVTDPQGG